MKRTLATFAMIVALAPWPFSGAADVAKKCDDDDMYVRIEGCSAIITNHQKPNADLVPTYYSRAYAYYQLGAYDRALADVELMLRFEKRDLRAYLIRGLIRHQRKDYSAAVADFDEAIRIKPDLPVLRIERARANIALEKFKHAIDDLDEVIQLDPSNATAFYLRGQARKSLGKADLAGPDWQRTLQIGGDDWLAWWKSHLGEAGLYSGSANQPDDADLLSAILACARAPNC